MDNEIVMMNTLYKERFPKVSFSFNLIKNEKVYLNIFVKKYIPFLGNTTNGRAFNQFYQRE